MTSTKVWQEIDVPLHINLAAQKVDVEEELRRACARAKRNHEDQIGGGSDWKRPRHTYASPPWRSGRENSWRDSGSWSSSSWNNSWSDSWSSSCKKDRDWGSATSGKRSRRW